MSLVVALLFIVVGGAIIALGLQRRVPTGLAVVTIVVGVGCMAIGLAVPITGV